MTTTKTLAADALSHMSKKTWCFDDNAPEWCSELAHHAHGDMLPDDWRHEFIREALRAIDECDSDDEDEIRDSLGEIKPDIYTGRLLDWLASMNSRLDYVDEYREKYAFDGPTISAIMGGQMLEQQEVAKLVLDFLADMADE